MKEKFILCESCKERGFIRPSACCLSQPKKTEFIYPVRHLVTNEKTGEWCKIPYPGHAKGCPNYGKADRCPPKAPAVSKYFDLSKPLFLVHSDFDLEDHQSKMKANHPEWSDRQCRCVLYWQRTSRKQLKERIAIALRMHGLNAATMIPEAMGVNVYATARASGLILEPIRTLKKCRHVALVGTRL